MKVNMNGSDRKFFLTDIVWRNVILFVVIHLSLPYACLVIYYHKPYLLIAWNVLLGYMSGLGVTAGAHRLWAHRAYEAKLPLRLFLAFWFVIAGQNDIYEWCRDHRVHHKFSETDADPHNSKRGFFFAHMGWLCLRKHPEVLKRGQSVDMSDLLEDPVVVFQRKYYVFLFPFLAFLIPAVIPWYFWNQHWFYSFGGCIIRYCLSLHVTWLVNSAAHWWGSRPYNTDINPRESPVVIYTLILGEGFHNYHHSFPQDYRASEYGWLLQLNLTALFIDLMALLGQAYGLKMSNKRVVEACKRNALRST